MSLYEQIWSPSEYEPRKEVFLRDFPKNHLGLAKSVDFQFEDYKVYDKLSCMPYERMTVQCLNHYGVKMLVQNKQCRDIANAFHQCLQINSVFGFLKRTQPEYFATSEYSREKPNFSELAI